MADADRRRALELGGVGDEDDVPCIGDDRLRDLDLAKVEIEQGAVMIDRRGADDGIIDLELLDEIDGGLADNAAVRAAHHAAGDHHLDRGIDAHPVGNIDVIGDNHQPVMVEKRLAHGLGRGADVDEKRGVIRDQPRRRKTDRLLLVGGDLAPRLVFHVLDAGREQRPAMDASQQALVA